MTASTPATYVKAHPGAQPITGSFRAWGCAGKVTRLKPAIDHPRAPKTKVAENCPALTRWLLFLPTTDPHRDGRVAACTKHAAEILRGLDAGPHHVRRTRTRQPGGRAVSRTKGAEPGGYPHKGDSMTFNIRAANLRTINSMTKYPSIPTYHALDPANGGLLDEVVTFTGPVFLTEKVDGTNGRIISLPDGTYLIGSREELLYARGDLIGNPALGIVDALKPIAERMPEPTGDRIVVRYLEVYGGKVTAGSKHYTHTKQVGARLFDMAVIADYREMLDWQSERISSWRDNAGQRFLNEDDLITQAAIYGLDAVPRLDKVDAGGLPTSIQDARDFLALYLPQTMVSLDGEPGRAEGIVFRDDQRRTIAKARFQDYDRTLKRRGGRR